MPPGVYKSRALSIAWPVRPGKKEHFPEELHLTLFAQVKKRIPAGAPVVLLGDGEFDGTRLQHTVQEHRWSYVVRTGSNITVMRDGERFRCDTVADCIKPATLVALTDVRVTEAAYGPLTLIWVVYLGALCVKAGWIRVIQGLFIGAIAVI